jgi:hypothetical protein
MAEARSMKRLAWFVLLYSASVLALGFVAYGLRLLLKG